MESILMRAAVSCTIGATIGFLFAVYKKVWRQDKKTMKKNEKQVAFFKKRSRFIVSLAFFVLGIGLIWTLYYLILGVADPAQTEYATNVSQLIVSVLTVFSIIIAFYQFLRER